MHVGSRMSMSDIRWNRRYQAVQRRKEQKQLWEEESDMEIWINNMDGSSRRVTNDDIEWWYSSESDEYVPKKREKSEKRLSRGDTSALDDFLCGFQITDAKEATE